MNIKITTAEDVAEAERMLEKAKADHAAAEAALKEASREWRNWADTLQQRRKQLSLDIRREALKATWEVALPQAIQFAGIRPDVDVSEIIRVSFDVDYHDSTDAGHVVIDSAKWVRGFRRRRYPLKNGKLNAVAIANAIHELAPVSALVQVEA